LSETWAVEKWWPFGEVGKRLHEPGAAPEYWFKVQRCFVKDELYGSGILKILARCRSCGQFATLREAEFGMNIGLLVARLPRTMHGPMCLPCIHQTFWWYTLITLFLGWWGIISFIVAPFILILNVFHYCRALLSRPHLAEPAVSAPPPSEAILEKLRLCRQEMFQRLLKGESMEQVSEDIAERVGASPEDVTGFYNNRWK
jgi:hypothetical protein